MAVAVTQGNLITYTDLSGIQSDATSRNSSHCPSKYSRHNGSYGHNSNLDNSNSHNSGRNGNKKY